MPVVLHTRAAAATFLVIGLLATPGCDDNGTPATAMNGGVGPSSLSRPVSVSRGAMVEPSFVDARRVGDAICPVSAPFLAPFNVVVDGDGRSDRFFGQIHAQFVDSAGAVGDTLVMTRPELTRRFGSTAIPVAGARVFPFAFPFGCVGLPTGTLAIVIVVGDDRGGEHRTAARIHVR